MLFGLIFLGALVALLRAAAGPATDVYVALAGGSVFLALTAAGLAAEVAIPAAIVQFNDVTVTAYSQPFLALSFWLYHFSQIGSAAMIFATAIVVSRTGVLPRWTAALAILGVLPLVHTWIGLPAAYNTVAWVGLTGLSMLVVPVRIQSESVEVQMITAGLIFAGLAAALHVYIWVMESFLWTTESVRKTFKTSVDEANTTKLLALNQGFYNLFLAIVTGVGIAAHIMGHDAVGTALVFAGIGSMAAASVVLVASDRSKARSAVIQGIFPVIALVLLVIGLTGS